MTFQDESTDFYEKYLIENNGLELKLGVIDEMEFAIHFFRWNSVIPNGVDVHGGSTKISIQSLWKRVVEPKTQYLEDYGNFAIDIADIPALSASLRKVSDDLLNDKLFERDPDWVQDNSQERDWLEHGLQDYGGELVFCKQSDIHPYENNPEIISYEILAHVHQWPVRHYSNLSKVEYHILIAGYAKNLSVPDSGFETHDYCSIFISLDKVEEFISILEKMATDIVLQNEKTNVS